MTLLIRAPSQPNAEERMRVVRDAIGGPLQADLWPTLAGPLPQELQDLIEQLVAFEARKRRAGARPAAAPIALANPRGR